MRKEKKVRQKRENGFFKVPHTLVIIAMIAILVSVATYFIPGGQYERGINEQGRTVVLDGSFQYVDSVPQDIFSVLQAPIEGIVAGAEIIAFLLIIGGTIHIITQTRSIDMGIVRTVTIFKGREIFIIPIVMFMFSLGGAIFGMTEEAIPFTAILVPLMLALGYDSITAVGVTYLGCVLGFGAAMLNPFNVGVAQSIAEIPMYSGVAFRTVIWVVSTIIGMVYVTMYARKVKANPKVSPVYAIDLEKHKELEETQSDQNDFKMKHRLILILLALCMGVIVWGVLTQGFWIPQIAAVFLATGIISGFIGGMSPDEMAASFIAGAKDLVGAAIMVGFARSIVIIAEDAMIIDTVLYQLSNFIGQLPTLIAAWIMLPVHMVINFFVSSGSGQAALTMPILAPLGDLLGISRQLSVLIYQLGDGFSNAMFPTSATLIACLSVAKVPYTKWFRWILPLQGMLFGVAIVFITIAYFINWQ